jgi:legumain
MTTCLGDLYSVAWMENSEEADLTHETLLQQYKLVKGRTSNNYTYNQGSHVMQYGALDIDREVAGNYIGMNHTGNVTPSASPGDISSDAQQRRGGGWQGWLQRWLSEAADWLAPVDTPHTSAWVTPSSDQGVQQRTLQHMHPHHMSAAGGAGSGVEAAAPRALAKAAQRHADLLPLMASATRSPCPRRRAAALGKLAQEVQQRRRLDRLAAAVGSRMLPGGVEEQQQQGLPAAAAGGGGVANGGSSAGAGAAKQRQQQRAGVVQDWECLRGMVQVGVGWVGVLAGQVVCG